MSHPFDRYAAFTDLEALKLASAKPLRKSMRVNLLKTTVSAFKDWAKAKDWQIQPVPWCTEAFFIDREDRETALGKDLLHLLGHTYMQEAASMLPAALLDPQPGETILDMSAAPGSKTTQIGSMMQGRGVIVANDVQEKRLWTLKAAIHRCGVSNVIVTKKVGQWFAKQMTERFDRVLCDAPCTAQGTSRKDSDALDYCSLENIGKMARLQRELLESAVHAAKVGGLIVYSTCTLTPEENEEVVASILQKYEGGVEVVDPRGGFEPFDSAQGRLLAVSDEQQHIFTRGIEDSLLVQEWLKAHSSKLTAQSFPSIRLWPQTYDTEGFFSAVLRKTAPTKAREPQPAIRFQEDRIPPSRQREFSSGLEEKYGTSFLLPGDRLFERASQLILTNEEVSDFALPVSNYALGMPFARRIENTRIRIDHDLVTLRGGMATKGILDIDDATLDLLLDGKDAVCPPEVRGDVLLRNQGMMIGTSLAKEGRLFNRLPRWIVRKS